MGGRPRPVAPETSESVRARLFGVGARVAVGGEDVGSMCACSDVT